MLSMDFGVETPRPFPLLASSEIAPTKDNALHSRTKQIDITFAVQWKREHYSSITS